MKRYSLIVKESIWAQCKQFHQNSFTRKCNDDVIIFFPSIKEDINFDRYIENNFSIESITGKIIDIDRDLNIKA